MRIRRPFRPARVALVALAAALLAACGPSAGPDTADAPPATVDAAAPEGAEVAVVHKSPTCDCCTGHEDYLAEQGYAVEAAVHAEDLTAWKEAQGIPRELWSCHTTEVGGYLVEGHVPAATIARLLDEQPPVDGIALPGMPSGSPGMGGVQDEPWVIESFVGGAPAGVFDTR